MPLSDNELIEKFNAHRPPAICTLGGHVLGIDKAAKSVTVRYEAKPEFCHSEIIVQGGFLTGMVDSAMAFAVLSVCGLRTRMPTLDINVSFISPGHPGFLLASARIVHLGKSTGFLAAELHQDERLVVTATSTARIYYPKP